LQYLY